MPVETRAGVLAGTAPSLADAAIVAVAATKRSDAIATFDQKLRKRAKTSASPRTGSHQ
jgi:predicted nucleic acid-binding protein